MTNILLVAAIIMVIILVAALIIQQNKVKSIIQNTEKDRMDLEEKEKLFLR